MTRLKSSTVTSFRQRFMEPCAFEREYILTLRYWSNGTAGRVDLWTHWVNLVGPGQAEDHLVLLNQLTHLIAKNAHRPMMQGDFNSLWPSVDEAKYFLLTKTAMMGDTKETREIARQLVLDKAVTKLLELSVEVGEFIRFISSQRPLKAKLDKDTASDPR